MTIGSDDDRPTERLQPNTRRVTTPADERQQVQRLSEKLQQPANARLAAAQDALAALLGDSGANASNRSLVPPSQRMSTVVTSRKSVGSVVGDASGMVEDPEHGHDGGRLPSAWYKHGDELADAARRERLSMVVRAAAAACLITGAALLFWLGAFGGKSPVEPTASHTLTAGLTPGNSLASAPPVPRAAPSSPAVDPGARALVTTAQILAVAERFVATGDIRAARAMLSDTAATGDARALFALAETYDPNLLLSWNATDIESSVDYARLLYAAALKGGIIEAQVRLDALK